MSTCLAPACKWRPPGTCVYYSGTPITSYNINNGDPLDVVITKIVDYIGTVGIEETANSSIASSSATVVLSGAFNRAIQVNVTRDPTADNKLAIGVNGLYVPPASFSVSYVDPDLVFNVDGTEYTLGFPAVLTSGSYSNPSWITSLASSKVGITSGQAQIDAASNNITVVNAAALTTSLIVATIQGTDATATTCRITSKANGSFVITANAAATANTLVDYIISN